MGGRCSGRGMMTAGALISVVGLGVVMVKVLEIPRYWLPLVVGLAVLLVGVIRWATSRDQ